MRNAIDPKIGVAVIAVIVLILAGSYYAMNRAPAPVKAQDIYSPKVLADPDPPRPGQPGYHGHRG